MVEQRGLIFEDFMDTLPDDAIVQSSDDEFRPDFFIGIDFSIQTKEMFDRSTKLLPTHMIYKKFFDDMVPWCGKSKLQAECLWEDGWSYDGRHVIDVSQKELIDFFKEIYQKCEDDDIEYMFVDYIMFFELLYVPSFNEFCEVINMLWNNVLPKIDVTLYVRSMDGSDDVTSSSGKVLFSQSLTSFTIISYNNILQLYDEMFYDKNGYREPGPACSMEWYNKKYGNIRKFGDFVNTLVKLSDMPDMFRGACMEVLGYDGGSPGHESNFTDPYFSKFGYEVFLEVSPDDGTTDSVISAVRRLIGTINGTIARQLISGRVTPVYMKFFCVVDDSVVMNKSSHIFSDDFELKEYKINGHIGLWVPNSTGSYYMVNESGNIVQKHAVSKNLINEYRMLFQQKYKKEREPL